MKREILKIPVHFDTGNDIHHISLDEFINFSTDVRSIFQEFSNMVYSDTFKFQVVVLPPKDGSFLKTIGIISLGTAYAVIEMGYGNGMIKGITGHDLEYYGEKNGELLKDLTIGFLQEDGEALNDVIDNPKLIALKNNFYEKCIENQDMVGLEFSEKFTRQKIARNKFSSKINRNRDDPTSNFKVHELVVIAPVNIKNKNHQ